ncbi:MAG: hypothetical protein GY814_05960 [Gammaproteobacteria bacterium]|nr:hypothetical protein [Gammaproteobacteria bacterium]
MDRGIILSILGLTAIALVIAILMPGGKAPDTQPKLPWLIEIDPSGASRVFGLTLGKSTLSDARIALASNGKANIFVSPENQISLEAYFDRLYISGIKADMVLSLSMPYETLDAVYKRGLRISQLGGGTKKVTLDPGDMNIVATAVIERITYLPAAKLDRELIGNRFGKPGSVIQEKSGIEHWLYPDRGLDIALNPEDKEVFQYVNPASFDQVLSPLLEMETSRSDN